MACVVAESLGGSQCPNSCVLLFDACNAARAPGGGAMVNAK